LLSIGYLDDFRISAVYNQQFYVVPEPALYAYKQRRVKPGLPIAQQSQRVHNSVPVSRCVIGLDLSSLGCRSGRVRDLVAVRCFYESERLFVPRPPPSPDDIAGLSFSRRKLNICQTTSNVR